MRVLSTCATTSRVVGLVFLAGLLTSAEAEQPTITQMNLLPRQTKAGDIYGYLLNEGSYFPVSCPSSATISFSGNYARCQLTSPEPPLPVMTDCRNSSVVVGSKTDFTCTSSTRTICGYDNIYRSLGDPSPYRFYGCGSDTNTQLIFMQTTAGPSSTSTLPESTSAAMTTTDAKQAQTSSPPPPPPPEPQNLAWIAGPIIGGVAGIVIIGLLIWILRLRRKKNRSQPTTVLPVGNPPPEMTHPVAERTSYFPPQGDKMPADAYHYNSQMSPISPTSSTTPVFQGHSPYGPGVAPAPSGAQVPPRYQSPTRSELPSIQQ